jgi:hypothetical protein
MEKGKSVRSGHKDIHALMCVCVCDMTTCPAASRDQILKVVSALPVTMLSAIHCTQLTRPVCP